MTSLLRQLAFSLCSYGALFTLLSLGNLNSSFALDWRPPELRTPEVQGIKSLNIDPKSLKLEIGDKREKIYSVRLRGQYSGGADTSLIWTTRFIKPGSDNSFELLVPISGEVTPVTLVAIDPYGGTIKSTYEIIFDDWLKFQAAVESDISTMGTFSAGIGPTFVSYSETGVQDYSSIVLTAKAGYSRPVFSPQWSVGITGFATLIPITESYSASARFLGFNIRLGYHFLNIPPPWKFSLQIGSYYTTMFVSGNQFGFENVTGPQLYPAIQRTLNNGHIMRGYFKLSPLAANDSALSFRSREIAAGLEYVLTTSIVKTYSVHFDYSDLIVKLPEQTLAAKTISFSVSHGF